MMNPELVSELIRQTLPLKGDIEFQVDIFRKDGKEWIGILLRKKDRTSKSGQSEKAQT